MTVCIAALFRWNYGTVDAPQIGVAAITASDREITAGDVEYEPNQLKAAFITPRAFILVAGDYAVHSEAIQETNKQIRGELNTPPKNIALIYGQAIQAIKRRHAEDLFLAPFGMNTDTFLAQQRDLSETFVERIASQLQSYSGEDVEALVVASDGEAAHIHTVDTRGTVSTLDDLGFAAIGIGSNHAKSRLMQLGYNHRLPFAPALTCVFAAKRAAETAPGVGKATDIIVLTKSHFDPLHEPIATKLDEIYKDYTQKREALEVDAVSRLQSFLDETRKADEARESTSPSEKDEGVQPS